MDEALRTWQEEYAQYTAATVENGHVKQPVCLGPFITAALRDDPRWLCFHLSRYKAASRLLPQPSANVLELGCGEGLGTAILAQSAAQCTAVDGNPQAIAAAKGLGVPVKFIEDAFLGKRYGQFRACVSLDVLEHFPQQQEEAFLQTCLDNLTQDGLCILGTPNITAARYASPLSRKTHINLYDAQRLRSLLARGFQNVLVFGMNDEVLHTGYYAMCHYLLGIGMGKKA